MSDVNEPIYTKTFRSRLNELPLEMKCEIGEIPLQKGMRATARKEKVTEILEKYNIPFIEIGTGTNRYIIKYDGYVIKIALDREGIADNKQEFAMCELLQPHVAYSHEISMGGHLLVASYAPAFTSMSEMTVYRNQIISILNSWKHKFLLGDVGLDSVNYANWGLLANIGRPVCIDYAYIFPASLDIFKCYCGNKQMFINSKFTEYECSKCHKKYQDRELRSRISQSERLKLFNNVSGISMSEMFEKHKVDPKYITQENRKPDFPDEYQSGVEAAGIILDPLNNYNDENELRQWFYRKDW